jgi:plasmid stabilization system protein ParE
LIQIQDYITRRSRSLATAEAFIAKIKAYCEKLAALPGVFGRARPELMDDIRSSTFGNYVIFLRYPGDDTLDIVRVIEGRRDMDAFFADEERDE